MSESGLCESDWAATGAIPIASCFVRTVASLGRIGCGGSVPRCVRADELSVVNRIAEAELCSRVVASVPGALALQTFVGKRLVAAPPYP